MSADDTSHELYEQLAVGHALSALEPGDEQAFLAHLPGCAACARALVDHADTLAHLAYGAEPMEPPASLLEGIRAGVEASGRAGAFPAPETVVEGVSSLGAARERRRHRTVRATTAVLGAAASLVLVAALLFVNRGLQSENDKIQAQDAALSTAVTSLLQTGSKKVDLAGADGSRAVAVVNNGKVSLVLQGVPANDISNSVYVLWQRSQFGVVRAVGTFDVTSDSVSVINDLRLAGNPAEVKSLIVTQEKGRTAPPLAKGDTVVAGDA